MSPISLPLTIWREKSISSRDDVKEFNDREFPKEDESKVGELKGRVPFSGVVGKLRARGECGSLSKSLSNGE